MDENNVHDEIKIIYEDSEVIYAKVLSQRALDYFTRGEYKTRYSWKPEYYVIYEKNTKKFYVLTKYSTGGIDIEEENTIVNADYIYNKFPMLSKFLSELLKYETFSIAINTIMMGIEVDDYYFTQIDDLISDFKFNKKNPSKSMIKIKFEDYEEFFNLFYKESYQVSTVCNIIESNRYSYAYDVYSSDYAWEDWSEGYFFERLNNENLKILGEIMNFFIPLSDKKEPDFKSIAKILENDFSREVDNIIDDYRDRTNEDTFKSLKNDVIQDFDSILEQFGFFTIENFRAYVTTVGVLFSLIKKYRKVENENLHSFLKRICRDLDVVDYEETLYEYQQISRESWTEWNNYTKTQLEDIKEKIIDDPDFFLDVKEYKKILKDLGKYELDKSYDLPKDKKSIFRIKGIDPKTNKIIFYTNFYGGWQKRELGLDEFNNFLYHPELKFG